MDRRVVEQVRRCREYNRFVRFMVAWTGFRQIAVPYDRDQRFGGETKYNMAKLAMLAVDVVLGYSDLPLRIGLPLGGIVCALSVIAAAVTLLRAALPGVALNGTALLAAGLFFLGGMQLVVVGLLAEYVARVHRQSQQRPIYIIADKSPQLPKGEQGWADSSDRETAR
jgi:dolichol-phosphate mannosyltransferase